MEVILQMYKKSGEVLVVVCQYGDQKKHNDI